MARLEPKPLVKTMGVNTALVGGQLNKGAAAQPALGDRPIHHLPAETGVAAIGGDANRFDLSPPRPSSGEPRKKAKLKRPNDIGARNGDDEQMIRVGFNGLKSG